MVSDPRGKIGRSPHKPRRYKTPRISPAGSPCRLEGYSTGREAPAPALRAHPATERHSGESPEKSHLAGRDWLEETASVTRGGHRCSSDLSASRPECSSAWP